MVAVNRNALAPTYVASPKSPKVIPTARSGLMCKAASVTKTHSFMSQKLVHQHGRHEPKCICSNSRRVTSLKSPEVTTTARSGLMCKAASVTKMHSFMSQELAHQHGRRESKCICSNSRRVAQIAQSDTDSTQRTNVQSSFRDKDAFIYVAKACASTWSP
jgi:hypothetical protein